MEGFSEKLRNIIEEEHNFFKTEMIKKTTETVYDNYYKINFFESVYDYFLETEVDEETARSLCNLNSDILADLYNFYFKIEFTPIEDFSDIEEMISNYIEFYCEPQM